MAADTTSLNERLARMETLLQAHEAQCDSSKKILYSVGTAIVAVILGLFWHILLVSGRQEVVLATLQEHTSRMNAITLAGSTRDEGIKADIKELQHEMQLHIQGVPDKR